MGKNNKVYLNQDWFGFSRILPGFGLCSDIDVLQIYIILYFGVLYIREFESFGKIIIFKRVFNASSVNGFFGTFSLWMNGLATRSDHIRLEKETKFIKYSL